MIPINGESIDSTHTRQVPGNKQGIFRFERHVNHRIKVAVITQAGYAKKSL
jgi:hypothetical protein